MSDKEIHQSHFSWRTLDMKRIALILLLLLPVLLLPQRFGEVQSAEESEKQSMLPVIGEGEVEITKSLLEVPIDETVFIVGPGDKFSISIEAGETINYFADVTPAGGVLIPKVGNIDVSWMTLKEAKAVISEMVISQYRQSRVTVDLVAIREFMVPVTGAVINPGYFKSSPVNRVSDLIDAANPNPLADLTAVMITDRNNNHRTLNMILFTTRGDMAQNPRLNNGDKVHIPLANVAERIIVIRGAVSEAGYTIIQPEESLASIIARKISVHENADIENIVVIRYEDGKPTFYSVQPAEYDSFILRGGDEIEVSNELPVNVLGQVEEPGSFVFIPGYTASDYINLAGGILPSGASKGVKIIRKNGDVLHGRDILIQRGDIIEVNRSMINLLVGEISILQFVSTMATLVLAYSAVN